jgi:MFS family permease
MDEVIFALISPLIIKEIALDIPTFRTGFQVWLTLSITGLYFWPWLSDRVGRRTLLAVNIAKWRVLRRDNGSAGSAAAACRHHRRTGRHRCRLQDRRLHVVVDAA